MTEHDITRTPPAQLRRARIRFLIVSIIVPLVLVAIGLVVLWSWMPQLPDPVVTHWGESGPDGFGPPAAYVWILLGVGLVLPAFMAVVTLAGVGAHWGATARFMGAMAAGMSAFALVLTLGSVGPQRGLSDASAVGDVWWVVALGFAVLVVAGAAAWFAQPAVTAAPERALEPTHRVDVAEGERVVWVGTTTMPRTPLIVMGAALVLVTALTFALALSGGSAAWISAGIMLIILVALPATAAFRVRITPEGFAARSLLGVPRTNIPLAEIESARAVEISPFGEFGGWGWRISLDGRTGIVMHQGPAIEIVRPGKRTFVVTIDGAEQAAALLQAYVDAAASRRTTGDAS
ncbi:hypothetical protein M2317_000631 [Microbacterium sp. ZKA21]|uniref:DUF1648 domain-containing protein n=1 Tax=Microbacterium sp. ZKA21 TaxID=3381694 RepID=UPI003D21241A